MRVSHVSDPCRRHSPAGREAGGVARPHAVARLCTGNGDGIRAAWRGSGLVGPEPADGVAVAARHQRRFGPFSYLCAFDVRHVRNATAVGLGQQRGGHRPWPAGLTGLRRAARLHLGPHCRPLRDSAARRRLDLHRPDRRCRAGGNGALRARPRPGRATDRLRYARPQGSAQGRRMDEGGAAGLRLHLHRHLDLDALSPVAGTSNARIVGAACHRRRRLAGRIRCTNFR